MALKIRQAGFLTNISYLQGSIVIFMITKKVWNYNYLFVNI
jgi:hypothetical protein